MEETMKTLLISLLIAFMISPVIADEITVNIDRIALLTPPQQDRESQSDRIALRFDIPDSLSGKHIVYAEIVSDLNFGNIEYDGDMNIELQAYNIGSNWDSETASWYGLADDIDSLNFYSYTFKIDGDSKIFLDVTRYVKGVAIGNHNNFGLMLIPRKLDRMVYQFDQDVFSQIEANTRLRVICE
jgi:hypothetical protein